MSAWWAAIQANMFELQGALSEYTRHTQADFRTYVEQRDEDEVYRILRDLWYEAPDTRKMRNTHWFQLVVKLQDGTIPRPSEEGDNDNRDDD